MTVFGFHASHEQASPGALLKAVCAAERAGFAAAMCSDHFAPWSARQGHSGFAWAWLGAALQATRLRIGVFNAPGQRYHPAIIAQAAATLEQMFPGRFWMALGSGEALNEHITGDPWPPKSIRTRRLGECVGVMRRLFAGETVSHSGLIRVDRAVLYDRPATPPPLLAGAVSIETARWAGGWADGLITINQPHDTLRAMIAAFREGGGAGKRLALQVHLSYARDEGTALALAHDQWRSNVFGSTLAWNLEFPEQFDDAARFVSPAAVAEQVRVSSDPQRHVAWLQEYAALGFDEIYLHHVGQEQQEFIETFGERVLPALR
jgi:probable non-F420 flavinoid oxidoreductase